MILEKSMIFKFKLSKNAQKSLLSLDSTVASRILDKISWLQKQEDPLKFGKQLTGSELGDIRFRIGDYRAIATIEHNILIITIIKIGHRSTVYRQ